MRGQEFVGEPKVLKKERAREWVSGRPPAGDQIEPDRTRSGGFRAGGITLYITRVVLAYAIVGPLIRASSGPVPCSTPPRQYTLYCRPASVSQHQEGMQLESNMHCMHPHNGTCNGWLSMRVCGLSTPP
jgi:hypothetical protein